jgi:hypothetical protein
VRSEPISSQGNGRRNRRDVVEAEQDRERADRHGVVDERQEQQAHASERVVDQQEPARVVAVGQPAARDGSDEVEHAHHGERGCGRGLGEAVLHRVRDEVLADEAVRRGSTHEERPGEEPEVGRAHRPPHDSGIRRRRRADRAVGCAERARVDLGRVVAHERHDRPDQCQGEDGKGHRRQPPVEHDGEPGQQRDEQQLAGRAARSEDAGDQAAVAHEPAGGDGRPENAGDEPGAQTGQQPECQRQLPDLGDEARDEERDAGRQQAEDDDTADTETAHQRTRQRAGQAVHDQTARRGERDRSGRPAMLVGHRQEERARRRTNAGRDEDHDRRNSDDDPAIEEPGAHDGR